MDPEALNLALLIARVGLGAMLIYHGLGKLKSVEGTTGWFQSIGMKQPKLNAYLAAGSEIGAGALMAIGLLTTFSAAAFVGIMLVAAVTTHLKNGFFILNEGWEYVFIIAIFGILVATIGPGEYSIDNGLDIASDFDGWTGLIVSAIGGTAAGAAQLIAFWRPKGA